LEVLKLRDWLVDNTTLTHEVPSNNIKVGVCCGIKCDNDNWAHLFVETINSERCQFLKVSSDEYKYRFFQEDGVVGQYAVFGWWNFETVG